MQGGKLFNQLKEWGYQRLSKRIQFLKKFKKITKTNLPPYLK
jgi:hypothetical protein